MKYFFLLLLPMLFACKIFNSSQPIMQGISGLVYSHRGNMMPSPGRHPSQGKASGVMLYIYHALTAGQTAGTTPEFSKINSQPVCMVKTDNDGMYAVFLPAGKYSVFIKDEKGFFANESDGNGIINPVEVFEGKVTRHNWTLARGAIY